MKIICQITLRFTLRGSIKIQKISLHKILNKDLIHLVAVLGLP